MCNIPNMRYVITNIPDNSNVSFSFDFHFIVNNVLYNNVDYMFW